MIITKIHIDQFRGFINEDCDIGSQLTAIVGQNGTQKTTLLGIITQSFTLTNKDSMHAIEPLCGGSFISKFKDNLILSPKLDKPGRHRWTLSFKDGFPDLTMVSMKGKNSEVLFRKEKSRTEETGYMHLPTIFLSLRRLNPMSKSLNSGCTKFSLTEDEKEEFKKQYNKILIDQRKVSLLTEITSGGYQSVGVTTDLYDWKQNSTGQFNLGTILLALFSFKRLKDHYPDYKGGILVIDELDALLYPASYKVLLNVLRKYASELQLQILFTTHSLSFLKVIYSLAEETASKKETSNQVKLLYLEKVDEHIRIRQDLPLYDIQLGLYVVADPSRITVYTEDKETILLAKYILGVRRCKLLDFVKFSFQCTMLIDLAHRKVQDFSAPHSLIILDGDVKKKSVAGNAGKIDLTDNILVLPGNESLERMIARFLNELSEEDPLWEQISRGYKKQVCFKKYSYHKIANDRNLAKKWFNSQKKYWKTLSVVLSPCLSSFSKEKKKFLKDFDKKIILFNQKRR